MDCPRTRSAGMVMVYRPSAFVGTEMCSSVMKTLETSRGFPASDVTFTEITAPWARADWALSVRTASSDAPSVTARRANRDIVHLFRTGWRSTVHGSNSSRADTAQTGCGQPDSDDEPVVPQGQLSGRPVWSPGR